MSKWYSFKELKQARTPMLLDSVTGLPDNHVITVVERVISVDNSELIQNNVRTDTVTLDLDAEYDDLNVIIIFTKPNNINVQVAYSGQPVHIPGSVMELTGSVAVSVVGLDAEGETRAVTKAAPDTFQVVASGAYTGRISQDDVDLLGQILQAVSDTETAITAAETATTAATNATTQATSAATSANKAASSANSAASSANSAATKANSAAVDAQNAYDTLQPYMATIDSCANILHREVGPDAVVTADDSFPAKPVEMVVYGNTVQNLWVNPSGTNNGVTVTANVDGSITVSGTASAVATIAVRVYNLQPGKSYAFSVDKAIPGVGDGYGFYIDTDTQAAYYIGNSSYLNRTYTLDSAASEATIGVYIPAGATVSGTYRVMLNEGSEAEPWCPPGLNSVGDGGSVEVVTAGKNLAQPDSGVTMNGVTTTVNNDGSITVSGTNNGMQFGAAYFVAGVKDAVDAAIGRKITLSLRGSVEGIYLQLNGRLPGDAGEKSMLRADESNQFVDTVTVPDKIVTSSLFLGVMAGFSGTVTVYPQLELGSTATAYEPPNITTTPIDLQGHTLNALPDGTRDELHIDGGGNVVLEKRTETYIANGDEGWELSATSDAPYRMRVNNWSGNVKNELLSINRFQADRLPKYSVTPTASSFVVVNGRYQLYAARDGIQDASAFSEWLESNPMTVIYPLADPQTIDLGTITPPTMAAPNVTAYVADDTPAEMELDYVRDINVVVDRLEKKVADLVVMEATNV